MTDGPPTRIGGISVSWMERVRGFAIALGVIVAGIVLTLRGAGWGLIVLVVGIVFGLWVTRWQR